MSTRVNYFDLGLFNGDEIKMMINIFRELNIVDYKVFGFEAFPYYSIQCAKRFSNNSNIKIVHAAVGSEKSTIPLYMSSNPEGHSIYSSKNNVFANQKVFVNCIIFSDWLMINVPDFRNNFNILKVNIEGAEWDLLKDLESKNLLNSFAVYCGCWGDIFKIKELESCVPEYKKILSKNNIVTYRFTYSHPERNDDLKNLLRKRLVNLIKLKQ